MKSIKIQTKHIETNDQGERQPPEQQNRADDSKLNKNQNLAAVRSAALLDDTVELLKGAVVDLLKFESVSPPVGEIVNHQVRCREWLSKLKLNQDCHISTKASLVKEL